MENQKPRLETETADFRTYAIEIMTGENGRQIPMRLCEELVDGRWEPFYAIAKAPAETRITNYGIFCTVSGGLTGTRTAWLKDETGKMPWKGTKAEAETKASELNRSMNGPNKAANFNYQAMERN